jgi:S-adenosylmethionine decarboxylase
MQGLHLICDAQDCGCDAALMLDPAALEQLCKQSVQGAGLQRVNSLFHKFATDPQSGVTGVVLLAESHIAVHTWPELNAVTLDVYVCNYGFDNSAKAESLMNKLLAAFAPTSHVLQRVERGS